VTLEDGIDLIIHVVVQLHLDKLWIFADREVKKLLSKHILLTFAVEGFICNLAFLKFNNTFFK